MLLKHEVAVPAAVLSGLLFAASFGLYRFIVLIDRTGGGRRGPGGQGIS